MAEGVHKITEQFEQKVAEYTGAPYAIALDNCSNALFLALTWYKNNYTHKDHIQIPRFTYPAVPCEIIHAGFKVSFQPEVIYQQKINHYWVGITKVAYEKWGYGNPNYRMTDGFDYAKGGYLTGEYQLFPSPVWDSALRFTSGMYRARQFQCLSFTGPYKHLKLSKGGMILTDDEAAAKWFKRMRFSGRNECSYHDDNFDMLGWNFYMMPELAARGLLLMSGIKDHNDDVTMKYPDLSKFKVYQ